MAKTDNRDKHASPSSVQQQQKLLKTKTLNKSKYCFRKKAKAVTDMGDPLTRFQQA